MIREGMARDDYSDPGPYKYPQGTVAYEVDVPAAAPARQTSPTTFAPAIKGKRSKPMNGMKM